jgi:threonine/homoserine/homoserine lactone efflux protein
MDVVASAPRRGLRARPAATPRPVPASRPSFATTAPAALPQVTLEIACFLTLAAAVARAGGWFRRSAIRRRLDAVTGTALVGLGLRVAVDGR